jgi:uncharacterized protein YciI
LTALAFFAVMMVHGPGWDDARPIREQVGWDAHARFMDELVAQGFVVLGGPLQDEARALLIVETEDLAELHARLHDDPWEQAGLLYAGEVHPWTIWLDGRKPPAQPA